MESKLRNHFYHYLMMELSHYDEYDHYVRVRLNHYYYIISTSRVFKYYDSVNSRTGIVYDLNWRLGRLEYMKRARAKSSGQK